MSICRREYHLIGEFFYIWISLWSEIESIYRFIEVAYLLCHLVRWVYERWHHYQSILPPRELVDQRWQSPDTQHTQSWNRVYFTEIELSLTRSNLDTTERTIDLSSHFTRIESYITIESCEVSDRFLVFCFVWLEQCRATIIFRQYSRTQSQKRGSMPENTRLTRELRQRR